MIKNYTLGFLWYVWNIIRMALISVFDICIYILLSIFTTGMNLYYGFIGKDYKASNETMKYILKKILEEKPNADI